MEILTTSPADEVFRVQISKVLTFLKTGKPNERTSALIKEILLEFKESVIPKRTYKIYNCKADLSEVKFDEMIINSKTLAKHLKNCRRLVLLAATLGAAADTLIRKYSVQDMEKALAAQAVSSAMIETYCDDLEKEFLQTDELKGLFPVTRYSPGYGDFNIAHQKEILKLLNASRIGLSLTEAFMLTPSKSVTAIIGFT